MLCSWTVYSSNRYIKNSLGKGKKKSHYGTIVSLLRLGLRSTTYYVIGKTRGLKAVKVRIIKLLAGCILATKQVPMSSFKESLHSFRSTPETFWSNSQEAVSTLNETELSWMLGILLLIPSRAKNKTKKPENRFF